MPEESYPAADRSLVAHQVLAEDERLAGYHPEQTGTGPQQAGLTGSVGAAQEHHVAPGHVEIDSGQDGEAAGQRHCGTKTDYLVHDDRLNASDDPLSIAIRAARRTGTVEAMQLVLLALLAGALAGWVAGRRPAAATPLALGRTLVPAAVVALLVGERWLGGGPGEAVMAGGYALLIAFAVRNGRRPGLALVALGLLANAVVVVADGGMPVNGQAPGVAAGAHHHGLSTRDHLAGLADTIRLAPLGETVSPGDLLVAAGGGIAVFFWLEPAAGRSRRDKNGRADRLIRPANKGLVPPS